MAMGFYRFLGPGGVDVQEPEWLWPLPRLVSGDDQRPGDWVTPEALASRRLPAYTALPWHQLSQHLDAELYVVEFARGAKREILRGGDDDGIVLHGGPVRLLRRVYEWDGLLMSRLCGVWREHAMRRKIQVVGALRPPPDVILEGHRGDFGRMALCARESVQYSVWAYIESRAQRPRDLPKGVDPAMDAAQLEHLAREEFSRQWKRAENRERRWQCRTLLEACGEPVP